MSRNILYQNPWLGVLSGNWNPDKHKELQWMLEDSGIDYKKQDFNVILNKVIHGLPLYTRAFSDGPRNFEAWSNDEGDT
ncbi:hypothetical protein TNCV_4699011 [Trichonephila clavipes]|nr:hypothetical protein TNCV_4699011 [Trichonephila clavipes]